MDSADQLADKILERDFAKASKAAKIADTTEPRAKAAYYDQASNRLVIELLNEVSLAIPIHLLQGLQSASPEEIAKVEITPSGYGLHWEKLNADFSVPALMQGIFGTKIWMAEIGKRGGHSTSKAKATASRENGKKGGRPKNLVTGSSEEK